MKLFTDQLPTGLMVPIFVLFSVSGSLSLRFAGRRCGWAALAFFAAGNLLGFVAATTLTLTLRGRHPNIVYALCLGGAFCLLQLMSSALFRVPLTSAQWLGVSFVAAGIIFLQWGRI